MQLIEHELEVTVRVHEVRAEYERQMEEYVLVSCFKILWKLRPKEWALGQIFFPMWWIIFLLLFFFQFQEGKYGQRDQ